MLKLERFHILGQLSTCAPLIRSITAANDSFEMSAREMALCLVCILAAVFLSMLVLAQQVRPWTRVTKWSHSKKAYCNITNMIWICSDCQDWKNKHQGRGCTREQAVALLHIHSQLVSDVRHKHQGGRLHLAKQCTCICMHVLQVSAWIARISARIARIRIYHGMSQPPSLAFDINYLSLNLGFSFQCVCQQLRLFVNWFVILRSGICKLHGLQCTFHCHFRAIPAGSQLLQCIIWSYVLQQKSSKMPFSFLLHIIIQYGGWIDSA